MPLGRAGWAVARDSPRAAALNFSDAVSSYPALQEARFSGFSGLQGAAACRAAALLQVLGLALACALWATPKARPRSRAFFLFVVFMLDSRA